jgi:hypothetical protein
MTATLDGVANKRKDKPEPTAAERVAEELVARAREQGLSLTGPDGLLKQLSGGQVVQDVRRVAAHVRGDGQQEIGSQGFDRKHQAHALVIAAGREQCLALRDALLVVIDQASRHRRAPWAVAMSNRRKLRPQNPVSAQLATIDGASPGGVLALCPCCRNI